jgi:uncharacterized membrane protein
MRGRLGYVDWLRGLAVLLMLQTHAYDAWLDPAAKATRFFARSRLLGGYPAPLFLFVAGLSMALLAEARHRAGVPGHALRLEILRRAAEVFAYALLFRLWMFTTSGFAKPSSLLRVDVLNCIGLSMAIVGVAALAASSFGARILRALALVFAFAFFTPWAWDLAAPPSLPYGLVGYWSGRVHGAFFPLFPWAGFTAAGACAGLVLARARHRDREGRAVAALAGMGLVAIPLGLALDRLPFSPFPRYDFWWTSPNYFLVKAGIVLLALGAAYAWNRVRPEAPSALRLLGRASLLVYWVHIEVVYGGIVAPALRHALGLLGASVALLLLSLAMLLLAWARFEAPRALRPFRLGSTAPPETSPGS